MQISKANSKQIILVLTILRMKLKLTTKLAMLNMDSCLKLCNNHLTILGEMKANHNTLNCLHKHHQATTTLHKTSSRNTLVKKHIRSCPCSTINKKSQHCLINLRCNSSLNLTSHSSNTQWEQGQLTFLQEMCLQTTSEPNLICQSRCEIITIHSTFSFL